MHFANQIVNDNTLFLVMGLPNMNVLKLAQIKEYLPIQKQTWDKIINMKQGENVIPHLGNIIILVAVATKDNLTF